MLPGLEATGAILAVDCHRHSSKPGKMGCEWLCVTAASNCSWASIHFDDINQDWSIRVGAGLWRARNSTLLKASDHHP